MNVFQQKIMHPLVTVRLINKSVTEIANSLSDWSTAIIRRDLSSRNAYIRWFPPLGHIKLNCDGAFSSSSSKASCRGVIRDH